MHFFHYLSVILTHLAHWVNENLPFGNFFYAEQCITPQ